MEERMTYVEVCAVASHFVCCAVFVGRGLLLKKTAFRRLEKVFVLGLERWFSRTISATEVVIAWCFCFQAVTSFG